MVIETTNRIITFLDKRQEPKQEPKQATYSKMENNENTKRDLARLDLEAQELVNRILDMVEARENSPH